MESFAADKIIPIKHVSNSGTSTFKQRNKRYVINNILEYLDFEEILKFSKINSIVFNLIKEKGSKTFALIKTKYLKGAKDLDLKTLENIYKAVLENESYEYIHVFQLFSFYLLKFVYRNNMDLSFNNLCEFSFLYNLLKNIRLIDANTTNPKTNNFYTLSYIADTRDTEQSKKLPLILKCINENNNLIYYIKEINFCHSDLTDDILPYLLTFITNKRKNLELLNLSSNLLGQSDISKDFLNALISDDKIKNADFSNNYFNDDIFNLLITMHSSNNQISKLNFNYNKFTLPGIKQVFNHKFDETNNFNIKKYFEFSFDDSPYYIIKSEKNYHSTNMTLNNPFLTNSNSNNGLYFNKYLSGLKIVTLTINDLILSNEDLELLLDTNSNSLENLIIYYDNSNRSYYSSLNYLTEYLSKNLKNFKKLNSLSICLADCNNNQQFGRQSNCLSDMICVSGKLNIKSLTLEKIGFNLKIIEELCTLIMTKQMDLIKLVNCTGINNYFITLLTTALQLTKIKRVEFEECNIMEPGLRLISNSFQGNSKILIY